MAKRSTDFWLGLAMALFLVCLGAAATTHRSYVRAEAAYRTQSVRITFMPHGNVSGRLASMLASVHRKLLLQTLFSGATAVAAIGVLLQIARRRNERAPVLGEA